MFVTRRWVSMLLLAGLGGCQTAPPTTDRAPVEKAQSESPLSQSLARSAEQIARATRELRDIEAAAALPNISLERRSQIDWQNSQLPPGMSKKITVPPFDGNVETLLRSVVGAADENWEFAVLGTRPALPPVVSKRYTDTAIIHILADIGQSISGAVVEVNIFRKTVYLKYGT